MDRYKRITRAGGHAVTARKKTAARGNGVELLPARQKWAAGPARSSCAEVCRLCGEECAKHKMDHCQQCAQACMRCADECRKMAAMA